MKLNPAKCKEMVISFMPNHNFLLRPIVIGNNAIERVNKYKILGVVVRNDLKWDDHIEYIYKNACKKSCLLMILKQSGIELVNSIFELTDKTKLITVIFRLYFKVIVKPVISFVLSISSNIKLTRWYSSEYVSYSIRQGTSCSEQTQA